MLNVSYFGFRSIRGGTKITRIFFLINLYMLTISEQVRLCEFMGRESHYLNATRWTWPNHGITRLSKIIIRRRYSAIRHLQACKSSFHWNILSFSYLNVIFSAWIGSLQVGLTPLFVWEVQPERWIQYALVFLPGLIVGRCFDLGYFKRISIASTLLIVVATILCAECTEYWHFVLCQGIAVGASHQSYTQQTDLMFFFVLHKQIGCGSLFSPTMVVIAHWFKKRRGLAMGFVASGSSIGGTVFPIAARGLLPTVG